ncbi:thiamine-phosphate kinase [Candidatus Woesearchaeota archaeon]|nr:thiamine-phosphate kinase [Candidatus Woesearchaeota archaeon]
MNIKDIGGEFALIKRITQEIPDKNVITQIGDDCAVLPYNENEHLLFTTDMLIEDAHFNFQWFTPEEIGRKAIEVNVSDIFAKGGSPKYCVISLGMPENISVEIIEQLYKGIYLAANKYKCSIVGGDTNKSNKLIINIAMLGTVKKEKLCLRSGAKHGDLLCLSKTVGNAAAVLAILKNKKEQELAAEFAAIKHHFTEPIAEQRTEEIAKFATAMIDVSDGLASEVHHLCSMSNVGAIIEADKIPLLNETKTIANFFNKSPLDYALYGGEDFALLFTLPKKDLGKLNNIFVIGDIREEKEGVFLIKYGKKEILENKGYDHFR